MPVSARQIKNPSEEGQVLTDQLTDISSQTVLYSKENGFALYNPEEVFLLPQIKPDDDFDLRKTFSLLSDSSFLQKVFLGKHSASFTLFEKLNTLVTEHANYEYTSKYSDSCLLGTMYVEVKDAVCTENILDCYPLPDVWKGFYQNDIRDYKTLIQLLFVLSVAGSKGYNYGVYQFMDKKFAPEIVKFFGFNLNELVDKLLQLPHYKTIYRIFHLLGQVYCDASYGNQVSRNILASFLPWMDKREAKKIFYQEIGSEKRERTVFVSQYDGINYWMSNIFQKGISDKEFVDYFSIRYNYYSKCEYLNTDPPAFFMKGNLTIFDFGKAYSMGLIPESEVIKELMVRPNAQESLSLASSFLFHKPTAWRRKQLKIYEGTDFTKLKETLKKVSGRILDIELKRGDSATEVSALALKLERVEGASVLVAILKAIGKDSFGRADYYYNTSYTKREVLSKLLRSCYPSEDDTAETLGELLKGTNISDKRLVETGMYAPQWLGIIEEYLGWKGLFSAAYYFHAHINEWCDDEKRAIIARYTPIAIEDLQQGAFDIDWFREIYKEIGSKRFEVVYDAAKYISSSAGHARIRKYADAVIGKMKAKDVKEEIGEKRNKDLLMSYCLIPLNKRSKKDLLERYLYLQQFLRESKAFGSQRQESEKRAVEIGIQNLAHNAGYNDVTRLVWRMDTEQMKDVEHYFTPQKHQGVDIFIDIDEEGKSRLKYEKAGKPLGSIPNRLRKYPYMEELRSVEKRLKSQYSRSCNMLEQAMEDGTIFYIKELEELTRNPIVWPLLKSLVFITKEGVIGFYVDKSLMTPDGRLLPQDFFTEVRIAHPFDLYKQEVWHFYREFLFEKEIRQPFKQVFRELYLKTEDEQAMQYSIRYARCRIQPRKTVAILNDRRWVPNYEEGLQKIFYKENIVATIYALADWFSPTDIESPTLEYIAFYNRRTYTSIPVAEVPDVIFSEVMLDVDLAVNLSMPMDI
ncbi:MAG: DUF4132 domain-containing protein [Tannerellaceae bacterium]|jgi:hypothetical protein|nr:DUF4132 domain-containing protein [Tannerellaceae bacterium]